MRIQIVGLEKKELASYIRKNHPKLKITNNPEVILCYGGDGTLLYAERHFPKKIKVMIRKSQICSKCLNETRENILQELEKKNFKIIQQHLLEAAVKKNKVYGLNDILIAHEKINTALRFKISLDGIQYGHEILGDGVLISTPFGSTGYYQSITRSNFQRGIGIAFNNTVNFIGHLVIKEKTIIKIEITRGPGLVFPDNAKKSIKVETGDIIKISRSTKFANLANFKGKNRKYNIGMSQNRVPLGLCQICAKGYTEYV
ncbi:MAG: hypothetical protein ABID45_01995 [Patescibacteria group bacterium]